MQIYQLIKKKDPFQLNSTAIKICIRLQIYESE